MSKGGLMKLVHSVKIDGRDYPIVRAGLVASYYIAGSVRVVCPRIADSIESYVRLIGKHNLRSYEGEDGSAKTLTDRRVERDLKVLRNLPKSADGYDLLYSSEINGSIGQFGIFVAAHDQDEDFPQQTSLVRFEFGENAFSDFGENALKKFAVASALQLGIQSGNVGFGFKRASGFDEETTKIINRLLPRYLGFDPCYNDAADEMLDHTMTAHWLNFLNNSLFTRCGGRQRFAVIAPSVPIEEIDNLIFIQAARVPPVGDQNMRALDLGCMPDVARFLSPIRVPLDGLGDDEFDVDSWLARLDEIKSGPWENV